MSKGRYVSKLVQTEVVLSDHCYSKAMLKCFKGLVKEFSYPYYWPCGHLNIHILVPVRAFCMYMSY